jgi:hypothetical protein
MSTLLLNSITGLTTSTELIGVNLDLYLREYPNLTKVGIATTATSNYFVMLNETNIELRQPYVSNNLIFNPYLTRLGIGTNDPQATLDVNGSIKYSGPFTNSGIATFAGPVYFTSDVSFDRFTVNIATVLKRFNIGVGGTILIGIASTDSSVVGSASTYYGNVGIGSTIPQQKLDVGGSVKISKDIYDSLNSSGDFGSFLTKDTQGIKWTVFAPSFSEGIFIYNDETLVGVQSFRGLNFKTGRSSGVGTDSIQAYVGVANSTIADVYVSNYWDYVNGTNNIYRMSNVGINVNNPSVALDIAGSASITQTMSAAYGEISQTLNAQGAVVFYSTLNTKGITTLEDKLNVTGDTTLSATLKVGVGGTVITTTGIGSVGIGTNLPLKGLDIAKQVLLQKALYDSNKNVGYKTEFYKTPRTVLGQVAVGATGEVISDRFFDAANLIRLNLDFIAAEAVGFITSTDYLSGSFSVPGVSSCRDDIKKILKSITLDITRGGNSQSVGAGLSYYNGGSLIHITSGAQQTATVVAITTAAQISQKVINNVLLTKSYQSGVSSIRQIRDLTIQDDASVNSNANFGGCSNVVSAIYTCAGIVTAIIGGGSGSAPAITQPDGKVVWVPPGTDVRNLVWVNKYGNDDNGGKTEGDAKLTIAAAAAVAQPGDTIMVRSGVYYENNPIGLRTDVSVTGQDLRLVTVVPQNSGKDVFHVRRGCLVENMNFACDTGQSNPGGGAVAFPPTDTSKISVSGYIAPGPATEGPSGRWRSPYVRNCTNFMKESIGMKIDGNDATASTIGANLKSMVCDSFTQYNEAGIGVSITNGGYAQLVSIFTINCDIAIYASSGGQCDLTNSNSSFGNFGLVADGLGALEFTANVGVEFTGGGDTIVFNDVKDTSLNYRIPYDGQALWFQIPVNGNYITSPMQQLDSVTVLNGGSGYSAASPPSITLVDIGNGNSLSPLGPEGIIAEVSPTVNDSGAITVIDIVNSGRNYLSTQTMRIAINGVPQSTSDYVANMSPIYFTVNTATSTNTGISTVTFNEFVPFNIGIGTTVRMYRISRILTSGHSFEYIGTGTDINTATPQKGGVPIAENQVVARNGAQIPYTSTNQKGDFEIGKGIIIDQTTNTIRGRDFSRAIQAEVTPLILALR